MLDGEGLHTPSDSETLSRILNRTAALLQARGCGVLLLDRKKNVLAALRPFSGLPEERTKALEFPLSGGSPMGEVVAHDTPVLLDQQANGGGASVLSSLDVQNAVFVPLALEQRDENNQVVQRRVMGAFCAFDKFYGRPFDMEDARLLGMMARQASAVLVTSQVYWAEVERIKEVESILESTSVGLLAVSPKGTVTQVNEAARIALGLDKMDYFGRPYDDLITRSDICELISDTLDGRPPTEPKEFPLRVKEGEPEEEERIYRIQMDQIRSEDRQSMGWVMVMENVTDIRRAEQMMAAFVDMISHELRTPLTSIRGFVATMLQAGEGVFPWETQEEFLQIVDTEAERLGGMIDEQLNIARIQNGRGLQYNFAPTDFRQLAAQVFRLQKQSSSWRGHELVVDIPEDFPLFQSDESKLLQVLHNLVGNALKYSPSAGKVTMSACQVDGGVRISVSDQGLGIPKEQLPKMFSQFFRVETNQHTAIKGTGLGLWLTKHMIEGHHGRIWVESEYGHGSTFHVFIPSDPTRAPESSGNAE